MEEFVVNEQFVNEAVENLYQSIVKNFTLKNIGKQKRQIFENVFDFSVCALGIHNKDIDFNYFDSVEYIKEFLDHETVLGHSLKGEIRINNLRANVNSKVVETFNTIIHECVHQVNRFKNKSIECHNFDLLNDYENANKAFLSKIKYFDEAEYIKMGAPEDFAYDLYFSSEDERIANFKSGELTAELFEKLHARAVADKSLKPYIMRWFEKQKSNAVDYKNNLSDEIQGRLNTVLSNLDSIKKDVNKAQWETVNNFINNKEKSLFKLFNDENFANQTTFCFDANIFKKLFHYEMNSLKNENSSIVLKFLTEYHNGFEIAYKAYPHLEEILSYGLPEKCPEKFVYKGWCDIMSSKKFLKTLTKKYGIEDAVKLVGKSADLETFVKYFCNVYRDSAERINISLNKNKTAEKEMSA